MKLKIIHTSDLHGYFFPTDYLDREEKETGYLSLLNNIKKDEHVILTDGGDTLQGSSFDYFVKESLNSDIIADIMQNVDYYTLGNHDFNYGYEYLKTYIENMKGKLVCANVKDKLGKIKIDPYAIKEIDGYKIGFAGIVTDWVNLWEREENIKNFEITDAFEGAKKVLEEVRKRKKRRGEREREREESGGGREREKPQYWEWIQLHHQNTAISLNN